MNNILLVFLVIFSIMIIFGLGFGGWYFYKKYFTKPKNKCKNSKWYVAGDKNQYCCEAPIDYNPFSGKFLSCTGQNKCSLVEIKGWKKCEIPITDKCPKDYTLFTKDNENFCCPTESFTGGDCNVDACSLNMESQNYCYTKGNCPQNYFIYNNDYCCMIPK